MSAQPHPNRVRLLPWNISDRLIDAILLSLLAVVFVARFFVSEDEFGAGEAIAFAIAVVLILVRRKYPVGALALAIASTAVVVVVTDRVTLLLPFTLLVLLNLAQRSDRRTTLIAGAVTTASFLLLITVGLREAPFGAAALASFAWPALAATAGSAVRSARENVSEAHERARRAEASREIEAQRRVTEERLRIARDVHDLVAHHIAVINVQSAVAGHLIESDPAAAAQAIGVVRGAASTVIGQLGELLSVMRSDDDVDEPTAPTPELADIDGLISSFASSGLAVRHETSGAPRPMSRLAELAAYRVVQEALTNAHKHGDGTAIVSLRYGDAGLDISVTNPVAGNADTDQSAVRSDGRSDVGFGLIGMRERVEAVGGRLEASAANDGHRFAVDATIPATGPATDSEKGPA